MLLLVRTKSAEEVATAVTAYAEDDGGLEPFEIDPQNPLSVLEGMAGRHVVVSEANGWAVVADAASLDIADADEWGSALSAAVEATVVALDAEEGGIRVFVFDNGESDVELELPLGQATPAPALADLVTDAAGREILERGIRANTHEELVTALVSALGAQANPTAGAMIGFYDPLDEEQDTDQPRALVVDALLPDAHRGARLGAPLETFGPPFGVRLTSGDPVRGVVLEVGGSALELLTVEEIVAVLRLEGSFERTTVEGRVSREGDVFLVPLPEAYLEAIAPPSVGLDHSDMFGSMQRMMRAGEDQTLNTISVAIVARGAQIGQGPLTLLARSLDGTLVSELAGVAITVTG